MEEKLTDLQVAEIKKAFSICDKDGSGSIDLPELKTVMTAILDEEPSEAELAQLMKTIDKDHSGTIEWEEFLDAMTNWFKQDYKVHKSGNSDPMSQKKSNPDRERKDVHKKIKSFFAQFKKGSTFDKIRSELQKEKRVAELDSDAADMRMSTSGASTAAYSSNQKLRYLEECKKMLERFPAFHNALNSDNPLSQLEAMTNVVKLLSIVEVFATPQERRGVAEVIIKIFELFVQTGMTPRIIHILQTSDPQRPQLQELAARILTYFIPGPRIASTPEDSLLHPNQMFFKKLVISEGGVPILIKLLHHPVPEVRQQGVLALGWLAAHNPECRDHLLHHRVVPALLHISGNVTDLEVAKALSWTFSILCGVTHPRSKLPSWEAIAPMLPHLGNFLFSGDEDVLANVLSALSLVLPGVPEANVCRRLVQLLASPAPRVQRGGLQTITYVLRFDDKQTQFLIDSGLTDALAHLLRSDDELVRVAVCETLIVLAGVRKRIQAIIKADIVPRLLQLLATDELMRWKVAKVVKYITRGNAPQIEYLVKQGVVQALAKSLVHFKVYDQVLTEIYKFCGPSFNFEFVRDVLAALDNIVNVGEMEAEEKQKLNQYALSFDMGCVDSIRGVLQALRYASKDELDAWRQNSHTPGEAPVEDKIRSLLFKIKRVHDGNSEAKISRHISQMIGSVWKEYYKDNQDHLDNKVLVKCYHGDDIRVVEVPRDVRYQDFLSELQGKYVGPLTVTYKDEEGESITIDSQGSLETAIHKHLKEAAKTLKLRISIRGLTAFSPLATPSASLRGSPIPSPRASPPGSPLRKRKRPADDVPVRDDDDDDDEAEAEEEQAAYTAADQQRSEKSRQHDDDEPVAQQPRRIPAAARSSSSSSSSSSSPQTQRRGGYMSGQVSGASSPMPALHFPLATPLIRQGEAFSFGDSLDHIKREEKKALLAQLEQTTHFSRDELEKLYANWLKQARNGYVGREEFEAGLNAIGISDPLIIEQNFSAFDHNKDGKINFREFVTGLSVVQKGTMEERLKFLFDAYDVDGSGTLTPDEVYNIFKASLASKGETISTKEIRDMVDECFRQIDVNGDGEINYEEFKTAVTNQQLMISCFVHYPTDHHQQ